MVHVVSRDGNVVAWQCLRFWKIDAQISGLHITGGNADNGGAINTSEALTLKLVEISQSTATGSGGAILNNGDLRIESSTLAGNRANFGGGISNSSNATANVIGSTLSANIADTTAGAIINSGNVVLVGSTVTGNTATTRSGGLYNNNSGTTQLNNTIVAGNTSPVRADLNQFGTFTGSHNLIGDPQSTVGDLVHGDNSNIVGQEASGGGRELLDINTVLLPLTANGGQTRTHALSAGSPAIDAGGNNSIPAGLSTGRCPFCARSVEPKRGLVFQDGSVRLHF